MHLELDACMSSTNVSRARCKHTKRWIHCKGRQSSWTCRAACVAPSFDKTLESVTPGGRDHAHLGEGVESGFFEGGEFDEPLRSGAEDDGRLRAPVVRVGMHMR